jgi:Apea-like HEPN
MSKTTIERQNLIEAVNALPDEVLIELTSFVEYLRYKTVQPQNAEPPGQNFLLTIAGLGNSGQTDILDSDEKILRIVETLSNDPRVEKLAGSMISRGCSAQIFEIKTLGNWFLWLSDKVGSDNAEKALNNFLDNQIIQVFNCLWVLGIKVDREVNLCEGVKLLPIEQMPDSRDKDRFLPNYSDMQDLSPRPESALIYLCDISKTTSWDIEEQKINQKDFCKTSQKLHDIALLMNLLSGVSCLPFYATSYVEDSVPFGPFSGSGGSRQGYDIFGVGSTHISNDSSQKSKDLYEAFFQLDENEKNRWRRILCRLSQAKRREEIEDKILDLGISLEMMLLDDNRKEQLSRSFRLRGSWLISNNKANRTENCKILKDIYTYRSQVAHTGLLEEGDFKKICTVRESFGKYQELAETIGMRLLVDGKPDWNKLEYRSQIKHKTR